MRVAIYARVSTDDKGQDPENQLRELRAWAVNSGHAISGEYVDYESGRKGTNRRKQFAALFDDASKRTFDCVLFWALDRFSREGMAQTILHLQRLSSYGVAFHSYTEAHLATDNELVRNILLALLSSLAKVEAEKISERTKTGMARAKAKKIGKFERVPQQLISSSPYTVMRDNGKNGCQIRVHAVSPTVCLKLAPGTMDLLKPSPQSSFWNLAFSLAMPEVGT